MRHAVISTTGTSLLTNGVTDPLRRLLLDTANLREDEYEAAAVQEVRARVEAVRAVLDSASEAEARRLSAELNGILALGAGEPNTCHYLLCTDTFQGRQTAAMVAQWLAARRCDAVPQVLDGLSTASRAAFARGIDSLLGWCEGTLPELRRQGYRITFNLVGGFKSLQAYAHTLGMFYADEIVYIFEGKSAELIRIPRLPLAWESGALERHAAAVARLAQGDVLPKSALVDLPEAYLEIDEAGDATLSEWGRLAWSVERKRILAGPLLEQPGLSFSEEFRRDYERRTDGTERAALQEALARVASLWQTGGLQRLRGDHGLQYKNYTNRPGIGHFYVNDDLRVSCELADGSLRLRHFGPHNLVNDNP